MARLGCRHGGTRGVQEVLSLVDFGAKFLGRKNLLQIVYCLFIVEYYVAHVNTHPFSRTYSYLGQLTYENIATIAQTSSERNR